MSTVQEFICDACGFTCQDDNAEGVHVCKECGEDMRWLCGGGIRPGDYTHISESLAINPSQTKAHRKLFPGVDVLPDGRLGFNSVQQQSKYCQQTGFEKMPQKIKKHGKRIA
jgi:hypothetical protein